MNSTSNISASTCVLEEFVVWSPSCPPRFIDQYKAISITFVVAAAGLLMLHTRNFAVRLVKENFKLRMSNSIMMNDVAWMLASLCTIMTFSNYKSIHYDDGCTAAVTGDLRLSFLIVAM
jgi:hypothetical protein